MESATLTGTLITIVVGLFGLIIAILRLAKRSPTQVTLQCPSHNQLENKVTMLERDITDIKLFRSQLEGKLDGISRHLASVEDKVDALLREKHG